jgi:hypothetical protein
MMMLQSAEQYNNVQLHNQYEAFVDMLTFKWTRINNQVQSSLILVTKYPPSGHTHQAPS